MSTAKVLAVLCPSSNRLNWHAKLMQWASCTSAFNLRIACLFEEASLMKRVANFLCIDWSQASSIAARPNQLEPGKLLPRNISLQSALSRLSSIG
mmetsp:Transcript_53156/g.95401  ORF Transcript_53156/g.95401 Transcript_53156/m.95401 type:complete len:95 (-) Transcript_53156:2172-2456(-)